MVKDYDFCGWATKANLKCSDGRVILPDAFKDNDGKRVPLVWDHIHNQPDAVLGHAILENRDEGVFAYGYFNESENGKLAKVLVEHGDICAMSIFANQLKQRKNADRLDVMHGDIKEVSLVLASANPGASINQVLRHSDGTVDTYSEEEGVIYTGEKLVLAHSDKKEPDEDEPAEDSKSKKEDKKDDADDNNETVADVFNTLTDKQKDVVYAMLAEALKNVDEEDTDKEEVKKKDNPDTKKEETEVKHNIFDQETENDQNTLSHSDQEKIIALARSNSVGSLRDALEMYVENNDTSLKHGIDDIETLFPEYKDVRPGAPEMITRDQTWVDAVMSKVHKSPISRIRTRQADVRDADIRAHGYKKGDKKSLSANIKLLKRTTDPQTIYRKDALHRDDIMDITDFDVVDYQYRVMVQNLNEEVAQAALIGDGREEGDDQKIAEEHIRSIWHDDELYTIHADVDIAAAKAELQGTNTSANFGDNYVYAEAIITAALYSREKYKGSGNLDFFCTPHLLNVMLLARDLNGRRIYDSKADLAAALNVNNIYTVEQFEGKTRATADNKTKKLLGIFVNLSDYHFGSTKGGEITRFNQFDIDFNQEKYLIETRLSGALTKVFSAIALEEPVNP